MRSPKSVLAASAFVALALIGANSAQAAEALPKGRVIDRVVCARTPTQAYALYVPTEYTNTRRWPVIFCFDPGARGGIPVERLHEAAERFGYIVVGSLNSRNGPLPENTAAARAMVDDVGARFALDPARVYTAGMSGGARAATEFALAGWSKGVIACSAGFPEDVYDTMPRRLAFVFFGTAGYTDGNYRELRRVDELLGERNAPHRVVMFDGGHQWPPAPILAEAIEWLELQAMRAGTRPRDDGFIQRSFASRVAALPREAGLERWRACGSIAADFRDLTDVAAYEKEARELGRSRAVKDALKAEDALLRREESIVSDLIQTATFGTARERRKLATKLQQECLAPEDTPERRSVRRAVSVFIGKSREREHAPASDADGNAAAWREMAEILRPPPADGP